jgi:thiamine biosynthesis lipoprotein
MHQIASRANAPRPTIAALRGFDTEILNGRTMGTSYQVRLALPRRDESLVTAARARVGAALDAVDARMSTFKADSEVSLLNRRTGERPLLVSHDTMMVFQAAENISRNTGGAFDVTIGGCVNAWGFGPDGLRHPVAEHRLAALRQAVGYEGIAIDPRERTIAKAHALTQADLSAIAKGYGVDQAARALESLGVLDFMIEVGGEVRTRGLRHDGHPWRIGIEEPLRGVRRQARYAVPLRDLSMATSGDYRNFFDHGGRMYSHEIDPRTGRPISQRLTSVTVVAPECALADAYSTALIVLGPEDGFACARRLGLAAYFVMSAPDGSLVDRATPQFVALGGRRLRLD